jgi:hypothetical protein
MINQALKYFLNNTKSLNDLNFYFNFSDENINDDIYASGSGSDWTGVLANSEPSFDTGQFNAYILNGVGSSGSEAISNSTGFFGEKGVDLFSTNLRIPKEGLDFDSFSLILGFEFKDNVSNGVLFGAFEKEELQLQDGSFVTGSKGFNLGVTDRGHVFLQGYSSNGGFVKIIPEELSKKNYIGLSSSKNKLSISVLDFFSEEQKSYNTQIDSNYIQCPEYFYLGGANYYNGSKDPSETTLNANLGMLIGLNGSLGGKSLTNITKAALGDYFFSDQGSGQTTKDVLVDKVITYKTGVISYDLVATGTEDVQTFIPYATGSAIITGQENIQESSDYTKYYEAVDESGNVLFSYADKVGFLKPELAGSYNPTGQDASSILGLQDETGQIDLYDQISGVISGVETINIYEETPITGQLSEISGVEYVYETQTGYYKIPDVSGVNYNISAESLKKNYIYYMGPR